jgi:curli biogenesis system outer membrane secretion channel CsgG
LADAGIGAGAAADRQRREDQEGAESAQRTTGAFGLTEGELTEYHDKEIRTEGIGLGMMGAAGATRHACA